MCQGLGPREGSGMLPSGGWGMSLGPLPPGSPCSSPDVPSQATHLDLQDIEEVEVSRDTWLGE